ncbi:MAG: hypothetical protein ABI806_15030 [Candidatus Solibacter sp.]
MKLAAVGVAVLLGVSLCARGERLIYHEIRTDEGGKIIPWSGPPSQAYDYVVRLVWKFWNGMEKCENGVPYYMQHMIWYPNRHSNGLGGDQIPMALSSWNLLYGYLGDEAVKQNMVYMADYLLEHGLSKPADAWSNTVFPYDTVHHSGVYDGDMVAGKGVLQPDKAASFASELVILYKMTGNRRYLDAAVKMADMLVKHVRPGDTDHSPWPYRVVAATGQTAQAKMTVEYFEAPNPGEVDMKRNHNIGASYTTNWTGALRLFDALAALKAGDATAYAKTKAVLAAWLKAYPFRSHKWGPFFEDVPTAMWSETETNADTMAYYLLENPRFDPQAGEFARRALDWSEAMFANREWQDVGVLPINEQTTYKQPGNSHSSRHASLELLYGEKTGDRSREDAAIRRLNWATYMVDENGRNMYPAVTRASASLAGSGAGHWLTDGYGDYARHYLRAMASLPSLAPEDQNHLLRTTSVIRNIAYTADGIRYEKFDGASTERLKLGEWAPRSVTGGKMQWDSKTKVLTVQSTANTVVISRK